MSSKEKQDQTEYRGLTVFERFTALAVVSAITLVIVAGIAACRALGWL